MTLEELKNKKVTITVNKTIVLGEDLDVLTLRDCIEDQKDKGWSDKELLDHIQFVWYDTVDDIVDSVGRDYKVTIHD